MMNRRDFVWATALTAMWGTMRAEASAQSLQSESAPTLYRKFVSLPAGSILPKGVARRLLPDQRQRVGAKADEGSAAWSVGTILQSDIETAAWLHSQ